MVVYFLPHVYVWETVIVLLDLLVLHRPLIGSLIGERLSVSWVH